MKPELTLSDLVVLARGFCSQPHNYQELYGVTDGKAVGTFIEHRIRDCIEESFTVMAGNSALGLDLPSVETDIKVTSRRQPQSSCPFRSARQKVYGLGYHLLLLVYDKAEQHELKVSSLTFARCALIDKTRTADYQLTRSILQVLENNGNREDIFALLTDRNLPGDEIVLNALSDEIVAAPPVLGYLTISNALQWRLQYGRVVALQEKVDGIIDIV